MCVLPQLQFFEKTPQSRPLLTHFIATALAPATNTFGHSLLLPLRLFQTRLPPASGRSCRTWVVLGLGVTLLLSRSGLRSFGLGSPGCPQAHRSKVWMGHRSKGKEGQSWSEVGTCLSCFPPPPPQSALPQPSCLSSGCFLSLKRHRSHLLKSFLATLASLLFSGRLTTVTQPALLPGLSSSTV